MQGCPPPPHQILADQLTLSQPRGQIMPTTLILATPEFQTCRHPCNVFCLFSAVLINDQGEVLMMQEAKSTCAGQWYLPAGRMEPGEDIAEAAQREVLEETGLHFQLTTLLMAESAGKTLSSGV